MIDCRIVDTVIIKLISGSKSTWSKECAGARGGARSLSLYHAKRFEFGLHYFTCLEETRQAGIARSQKKKDEQLEQQCPDAATLPLEIR